jgi:hypothetical protein
MKNILGQQFAANLHNTSKQSNLGDHLNSSKHEKLN